MSASQQLIDAYVIRAVEEFKSNPLSGKLLRRLADELPERFCPAALRQLERNGESDAFRLLTVLVLRQPDLFEQISNPVYGTRERSISIVRRIMAFDSSFDVRLARKLPDRSGQNRAEAFTGPRAFRILDILDAVSSGRRLLPVLAHLVSSDDKKLSSRATLFVGRRVQSADWAAKQLSHPDHRVQASAVESIWGLRNPAAMRLLERAVDDPNNRVAGNAVLGLHIIEAPGVPEIILDMAWRPAANFRATAAWIMGRIASPGFLPDLNRLLKDPEPIVRGAALRALIEVRRYESQLLEAISARADELSEEEAAERARAAAEIFEPEVEEVAPAEIELHLDGRSYSYARAVRPT